ncbi:hypothetical protein STAFG_6382 [Streptomyces afghaniensis 772]|uniref:Uncharacterized protein n=1 Tax=Streptomyces afghaniensis 772 TaxID=1283301 RepID=S4MJ10_9ACTN|nr:hypothetical protein [Streptomyces sp. HP-A2021]EPJ36566.1 hypothetical protein STAFG_6382 [Streptomyces afghaniensis 772]UOB13120.1 hypothetical protein MQE23_30520 [Streptomyces sp. HP-A2021]
MLRSPSGYSAGHGRSTAHGRSGPPAREGGIPMSDHTPSQAEGDRDDTGSEDDGTGS